MQLTSYIRLAFFLISGTVASTANSQQLPFTLEWLSTGSGKDQSPLANFGRSVAFDPNGNALVTGWISDSASFGTAGTGVTVSGQRQNLFVAKFDQSGTLAWLRLNGSLNGGLNKGYVITSDPSGNAVIGGVTSGEVSSAPDTIVFGSTRLEGHGGVIAKYNTQGEFTWARFIPGGEVRAIASDSSGNIFASGTFAGAVGIGKDTIRSYIDRFGLSRDLFVAKFSSVGELIWFRSGNSIALTVSGIALDDRGHLFISSEQGAWGSDTMRLGGIPIVGRGIYLAKMSQSDGSVLWARNLSNYFDLPGGLACDTSGNVYFCGTSDPTNTADIFDTMTFAGHLLKKSGLGDILTAKFDSNGTALWARSHGGLQEDRGYSVVINRNGDLFISGSFHGIARVGEFTLSDHCYADPFIAKLSQNGDPIWAQSLEMDRTGPDSSNAIAVDPLSGDLAFTGIGARLYTKGYIISPDSSSVIVVRYSQTPSKRKGTWRSYEQGLQPGSMMTTLVSTGDRVFADVLSREPLVTGGIWAANSDGSWKNVLNGPMDHAGSLQTTMNGQSYTFIASRSNMYRSTDMGATWTNKYNNYYVQRLINHKGHFYGTSEVQFLESIDGLTWQRMPLTFSTHDWIIPLASTGTTLFVGGSVNAISAKGLYRLGPKGFWEDVPPAFPDLKVLVLAMTATPKVLLAAYDTNHGEWGSSGSSVVIMRSTDEGSTWHPSTIGLRSPDCACGRYSFLQNGGSIYMTAGSGIFRTNDDGKSWEDLTADIPLCARPANELAIRGDSLIAITNDGIYIRQIDLTEPSIVQAPADVQDLILCVEGTTMHIDGVRPSDAWVEIYDVAGRLVERHRAEPGAMRIDLSHVTAGTYIVTTRGEVMRTNRIGIVH